MKYACFGTQKCVLGGSEGSKHQKNAFFFAFLVTQGPTILQGRSLFSLKTLKTPDLFSFFSFFFSPVFEIFPRRPDANFQVFGKSWGLMVCPLAQRAEKLSDGLKKKIQQAGWYCTEAE